MDVMPKKGCIGGSNDESANGITLIHLNKIMPVKKSVASVMCIKGIVRMCKLSILFNDIRRAGVNTVITRIPTYSIISPECDSNRLTIGFHSLHVSRKAEIANSIFAGLGVATIPVGLLGTVAGIHTYIRKLDGIGRIGRRVGFAGAGKDDETRQYAGGEKNKNKLFHESLLEEIIESKQFLSSRNSAPAGAGGIYG